MLVLVASADQGVVGDDVWPEGLLLYVTADLQHPFAMLTLLASADPSVVGDDVWPEGLPQYVTEDVERLLVMRTLLSSDDQGFVVGSLCSISPKTCSARWRCSLSQALINAL